MLLLLGAVVGVYLIVFADDPEKWAEDSRWVRAVRTDSQGRYEVKGLPPGEYRAIALEYYPQALALLGVQAAAGSPA